MIEKALILALVALAIVAAASSVGTAIRKTLNSVQMQPSSCSAHAKDTCLAAAWPFGGGYHA